MAFKWIADFNHSTCQSNIIPLLNDANAHHFTNNNKRLNHFVCRKSIKIVFARVDSLRTHITLHQIDVAITIEIFCYDDEALQMPFKPQMLVGINTVYKCLYFTILMGKSARNQIKNLANKTTPKSYRVLIHLHIDGTTSVTLLGESFRR